MPNSGQKRYNPDTMEIEYYSGMSELWLSKSEINELESDIFITQEIADVWSEAHNEIAFL